MTFKLFKCKGPERLPLIEVPDRGYLRERLTPGTMREADVYENFRWTGHGAKRLLLACPRGKTRNGKCSGGQRVLRITHERSALKKLLKDCRSGVLYRRRAKNIDQILKDTKSILGDVGQPTRVYDGHPFIAPHNVATTTMGKLFQFALTSFVMSIMFTFWYRALWPEYSFDKEMVDKEAVKK